MATTTSIGDDGDNDIDGKGGTDRICGGDGNDVIEADGKLFADGGEGDDEIQGTDSADELRGGDGEDTMYCTVDGEPLHACDLAPAP
jgi:Ca2+-binding RTX toxin-like protein